MQEVNVPYEIVISDDCSTDNTPQIIEAFAKKDPRIRVLKHPQNVGMLGNWLQAINACQGNFVALCEGDDSWTDKTKLAKQLTVLKKDTSLSCCFTDTTLLSEKDINLRFNSYLQENDVDLNRTTFTLADFSHANFIPTCTIMFRKNGDITFPKEYFKSPYADWFLHIYNTIRGNYYLINEKTASYRLHSSGAFGKIAQDQRDKIKLKCLALLYKGYATHSQAKKLLGQSITAAIHQRASAVRASGKTVKFILLTILGKLHHLTGFATFVKQAARL